MGDQKRATKEAFLEKLKGLPEKAQKEEIIAGTGELMAAMLLSKVPDFLRTQSVDYGLTFLLTLCRLTEDFRDWNEAQPKKDPVQEPAKRFSFDN